MKRIRRRNYRGEVGDFKIEDRKGEKIISLKFPIACNSSFASLTFYCTYIMFLKKIFVLLYKHIPKPTFRVFFH